MSAPEFDVFLSYHSGDAAWVKELADMLRARGIRVWLDREQIRPGDRFVSALEAGLQSARCVVFVVSPGSVRSQWVSEEYHRALTLSHAEHGDVRLIPILIADAELPGFMSSRDYVDFRDPARFLEKVEELAFGITGQGQRPTADPRPDLDSPRDGGDLDEVRYLQRAIERERAASQRFRRTRMLAPVPGLAIAGVFTVVAGDPGIIWLAAAGVGLPVGTGLIGWGATAKSVARSEEKAQQLECLRDGLELCRARTNPGCTRLRDRFWEMVERRVSDPRA